jgi:hypothetical protein
MKNLVKPPFTIGRKTKQVENKKSSTDKTFKNIFHSIY